jgi:hypothetical protein
LEELIKKHPFMSKNSLFNKVTKVYHPTYFTILNTGFLLVGEGLVILLAFPKELPSISSTSSCITTGTGA